ncbi:MAG: RluA family pseudouridine synthase [Clostridiales bacterium]|nr:RluA family pseudouridine synthase [Clostridiales bacterium]
MGKRIEIIAEKEGRAVTFLSSSVAGLTRAKADILIKSGEVKVNGARIKTNAVISNGDVVSVFVPDELQKSAPNIKIVYEDNNIVVFDKPKRVAYDALPELYGAPLFAVHRLDTNTTGLIVFAKTEIALKELSDAFKDRRVQKVYEAVVYPAPQKDKDTLTAYTKLLHNQNLALVSLQPKPGYKTMVTDYEVKWRGNGAAVLRVFPHTGRTHQIRAHLGFVGCPIIGEHKYGAVGVRKFDGAPDSQMLAAVELTFFGLKGKMVYLNGRQFKIESGFDLGFLQSDDVR